MSSLSIVSIESNIKALLASNPRIASLAVGTMIDQSFVENAEKAAGTQKSGTVGSGPPRQKR